MQITIAQVQDQDLDEMECLYEASLKANPEGFIQDLTFHPNIKTLARNFAQARGCMLVLKEDDRIVGMGGLRNNGTIRQAMLCKLHVYAECQGKGYGRKLGGALIEQARALGYEEIILDVTKSQKSAIALYQKLGFKIYDERLFEVQVKDHKEYYDCLLMRYII